MKYCPLFSIMIPVYNVEIYLNECVDSILFQTEQDFEIILINDGSTDKSGKICDDYKKKFSDKIKVIHQKNKGLLLSRRVAISLAQGEYFVFVDSDDYLRNDALQIFKEIINTYKVDLILFNYSRVVQGKVHSHNGAFSNEELFEGENLSKLHQKFLECKEISAIWMKVVRNDLVDKEQNYENTPSYLKKGEDILQSIPIILNSKKAVYIDQALYYYRYNTESITGNFDQYYYESLKYILKEIENNLVYFQLSEEKKIKILSTTKLESVYLIVVDLFVSNCIWNSKMKKTFLMDIAKDPFFLEAFDQIRYKNLNIKKKISLFLLYHKKILLIYLLMNSYRLIYKIKKMIKKREF